MARTIIYASPPPETCVRLLCHSFVRRAVKVCQIGMPLVDAKNQGMRNEESKQDPQQPRPAQYGNVSMLVHVVEVFNASNAARTPSQCAC